MRDRKGRQGRFDQPGETGRLTGVAMRQNVARNEDGTERVDDFFGSPSSRSRRDIVANTHGKLVRRQARPDMALADGVVGRKTGLAIRSAPRDQHGVEDVPAFFASSPTAGEMTGPRSSAQRARPDLANRPHPSGSASRRTSSPERDDRGHERPLVESTGAHPPPAAAWSPGPDDGPLRGYTPSDGDDDVERSVIPSPARSAGSPPAAEPEPEPLDTVDGDDDDEGVGEDALSSDTLPAAQPARPAKGASKSRKREFQVDDGGAWAYARKGLIIAGTRRSVRPRVERLDYWRNERCVYKREGAAVGLVDVVRVPQSAADPLSKRHRSRARSASRARSVRTEEIEDYSAWDKDTDPEGLTLDYVDNVEVPERGYRFEKIFTDGVFMAGGVLEIPVKRSKAPKPSRDNSYIMYLTQGVLRVRVHRTVFTLAAGGLFMVPYDTVSCLALTPDRRGNVYELDNIGATTARIVFTQAREVKVAEGELDSDAVAELEGELSLR